MKTVIFAKSNQAAKELVAGAKQLGAQQIIQVALGAEAAAAATADPSGATSLALLELPAGSALENSIDSLKAWFATESPQLVLSEPARQLQVIVGSLAAGGGASAICNVESLDASGAQALYFGGIATRTLKPATSVAFYFVGAGVFEADDTLQAAADQTSINWVEPQRSIEVLESTDVSGGGSVDLHASSIVVSCGRGFSEKEDVDLAYQLADKIGAGVGCTRPLAETTDWFDKHAYIGVTGLMLSPKVFVVIGASGQTQHMIGATKAETIIAINKDKNAPVFKQCDIGITADLKQVLPALIAAL